MFWGMYNRRYGVLMELMYKKNVVDIVIDGVL